MRTARFPAFCSALACAVCVALACAAPAAAEPAGADAARVEADAVPAACDARVALLEKQVAFLRARLQNLEHDLASRPKTPPREPWRDPAAWRELRVGQSQADVLRILGAPGRVTSYTGFQRWEYPDALGARVNFDESGRLLAWGPLAR
jgi:hypothetical protein